VKTTTATAVPIIMPLQCQKRHCSKNNSRKNKTMATAAKTTAAAAKAVVNTAKAKRTGSVKTTTSEAREMQVFSTVN